MWKFNYYPIQKDLYLIRESRTKDKIQQPRSYNHVFVIDCSGSMSHDLPRIKQHLQERLPFILREGDTISIVWFSGRNEHGVLMKEWSTNDLTNLAELNRVLDRWLCPIGLTGFKGPLQDVVDLISSSKSPNPWNVCFMSDGHDNQWRRDEILVTARKLSNVHSAAVVEYGYYADQQMLTALAGELSGKYIFSRDFTSYNPFVSQQLEDLDSGDKIPFKLSLSPVCDVAWTLDSQGNVQLFTQSAFDTNATEIFYISRNKPRKGAIPPKSKEVIHRGLYSALSVFAARMLPDIMFAILEKLSDAHLWKKYTNCFSKQEYLEFAEETRIAATDVNGRFREGNKLPLTSNEDAITVLDVLQLLQDSNARILTNHPSFTYNRTTRGRVDENEGITDDDAREIKEIQEQILKGVSIDVLRELNGRIDKILERKKKIDCRPVNADAGVSIENIVYNETRPNVSLLVKQECVVDLSGFDRPSDSAYNPIPAFFPTYRFRSYTIIRDGMLNVLKLPCLTNVETRETLRSWGVTFSHLISGEVIIDLNLPVINRRSVETVSIQAMAELEYKLMKARARQKVFNYFLKQEEQTKQSELRETYGPSASTWLNTLGVSDGGFNPRTLAKPAVDYYTGKELLIKLKNYASIPSVKSVEDRISARKSIAPGAAKLIADAIEELRSLLNWSAPTPDGVKRVLEAKEAVRKDIQAILLEKARMQFAIIVGKTWFKEFSSIEETETLLESRGIPVKVELRDIKIHI